jgi:hypothetical protein
MSGEGTEQTLTDRLLHVASEGRNDVRTAIIELTRIAPWLDMRETSARLAEIQLRLDSDTFNLLVLGTFKTGKSTLVNALLGGTTKPVDLGGHKGPMVTDDLPATAVVTAVHYSEEPYVKAWSMEGKLKTWSLAKYLQGKYSEVL